MVKTIIGGVDVQKYTMSYSCKCPPVNGSNGFYDANGNYSFDRLGDEVLLEITLEDVPTPVSMALAIALEAASVTVDYTTPVPARSEFYKTDYSAECEDADPDDPNFDHTDGIKWTINLSLHSAALNAAQDGL